MLHGGDVRDGHGGREGDRAACAAAEPYRANARVPRRDGRRRRPSPASRRARSAGRVSPTRRTSCSAPRPRSPGRPGAVAIMASATAVRAATAIAWACTACRAAASTLAGSPTRAVAVLGRRVPRGRCSSSSSVGWAVLAPAAAPPCPRASSPAAPNSSRSAATACRRSTCRPARRRSASGTHSSSSTMFARAWSAVARPVGRYGVAANASTGALGLPSHRWLVLVRLAVARRPPGGWPALGRQGRRRGPEPVPWRRGDSSSTAAVPATDASHQPASRRRDRRCRAGRGDRQHVGEQRGRDAGRGVRPGHPGEEDRERHRDRDDRRQPRRGADRVPMVSATLPDDGEPKVRDGLVAPGAAERSQDQGARSSPKAANVAICRSPKTL